MGQRLQLQAILKAIPGVQKAYFQAPPNTGMKYPCIIYELDDVETEYADDVPYRSTKRYQITVIDEDPDSLIPDQIAKLPMSAFDRFYVADNLNHTVYNVFF